MVRPYWMDNGKISEGGVPKSLMDGSWRANRRDRVRLALKTRERRDRQEWLQKYWDRKKLTPYQRAAGARKVV